MCQKILTYGTMISLLFLNVSPSYSSSNDVINIRAAVRMYEARVSLLAQLQQESTLQSSSSPISVSRMFAYISCRAQWKWTWNSDSLRLSKRLYHYSPKNNEKKMILQLLRLEKEARTTKDEVYCGYDTSWICLRCFVRRDRFSPTWSFGNTRWFRLRNGW